MSMWKMKWESGFVSGWCECKDCRSDWATEWVLMRMIMMLVFRGSSEFM